MGPTLPFSGAQTRTAHIVVWLDMVAGDVVDVGIYSEATPTTYAMHVRPLEVQSIAGSDYQQAHDKALRWAKRFAPGLYVRLAERREQKSQVARGVAVSMPRPHARPGQQRRRR